MINVLILCGCVSAKLIVTLQDGKYHMGGRDTGVSTVIDLIKLIKTEFPDAEKIDVQETDVPIQTIPSPIPTIEWEPVSPYKYGDSDRTWATTTSSPTTWTTYTTMTSLTPKTFKTGATT